ncbi:MAG: dienelactone hydrolase family protein [Anaerolineae bacterium]|nr:dienelactone hydrolase family protein [Anaerolineae bacterium]MBL8106065.1 dienelactone hydrolase family protein [Anaerolineales bacterium]MCC7190681.1 dienelactone hydrolase family protein [Anaerolineales bacterium]
MYTTDMNEGIHAETVTMLGANGDRINAFLARPLGDGKFPAMVLAHHMPGWDLLYREFTYKFAHHRYVTISPNLYFRAGHGTPEDVAAKVRAEGGVSDESVVGDLAGAAKYLNTLPYVNGRIGIFGTCSGGRHAYLAACRTTEFNAAIDCWGGRVVMTPDQLNEKTPVSPLALTKDLSCPLLGIFGNDDTSPSPEQVNQHEAELKKQDKTYEFHRYDGAGHGFFYYTRPAYRQAQAMDGWEKVFAFCEKHLS